MKPKNKIFTVAILSFIVAFFICLVLIRITYAANPKLAWDGVTEATGYTVYYDEVANTGFQYNKSVTGVECPLADLNLAPGKSYKFVVTAYNDAGQSGYSNQVTYDVPLYTPPTDNLPPKIIIIPGPITITIGQGQ